MRGAGAGAEASGWVGHTGCLEQGRHLQLRVMQSATRQAHCQLGIESHPPREKWALPAPRPPGARNNDHTPSDTLPPPHTPTSGALGSTSSGDSPATTYTTNLRHPSLPPTQSAHLQGNGLRQLPGHAGTQPNDQLEAAQPWTGGWGWDGV